MVLGQKNSKFLKAQFLANFKISELSDYTLLRNYALTQLRSYAIMLLNSYAITLLRFHFVMQFFKWKFFSSGVEGPPWAGAEGPPPPKSEIFFNLNFFIVLLGIFSIIFLGQLEILRGFVCSFVLVCG